jgi:hypothetical protein
MSFFTFTYILLWAVVAVETTAIVLTFREIGVIYLARRESFERDGPPLGRPLPALAAKTLQGDDRTVSDLTTPLTALVFGTVGCNMCKPTVRMLERWSERIPSIAPVLLLEDREGGISPRESKGVHSPIWVLGAREAYHRYGVRSSPYVVIVDEDAQAVSKGLVNHHADIKRLLRPALQSQGTRAGATTEGLVHEDERVPVQV